MALADASERRRHDLRRPLTDRGRFETGAATIERVLAVVVHGVRRAAPATSAVETTSERARRPRGDLVTTKDCVETGAGTRETVWWTVERGLARRVGKNCVRNGDSDVHLVDGGERLRKIDRLGDI